MSKGEKPQLYTNFLQEQEKKISHFVNLALPYYQYQSHYKKITIDVKILNLSDFRNI